MSNDSSGSDISNFERTLENDLLNNTSEVCSWATQHTSDDALSTYTESSSNKSQKRSAADHPVGRRLDVGWSLPLPSEIFFLVFKFLCSQDLLHSACACREFKLLADQAALWRPLYTLRWGNSPKEISTWKMAYFERDAEEIQQVLSTSGGHEMRGIFLQMVVAKRLQARSLLDVDACPVVLESGKNMHSLHSVAEQVTSHRLRHSLGDGADGHSCSAATCTYHRIGSNVYVCEKSGRAHVCDQSCKKGVLDSDDNLVCCISGRCSQRWLMPHEEQCNREDEGCVGEEFQGGQFGRCFSSGYSCTSEAELNAAIWGGSA